MLFPNSKIQKIESKLPICLTKSFFKVKAIFFYYHVKVIKLFIKKKTKTHYSRHMETSVENTTRWKDCSYDAGLLAEMFILVILPRSCPLVRRTMGLNTIVLDNIPFIRGCINLTDLNITSNYL